MQPLAQPLTPEEYFALDEASDERLELWHGQPVAMAGETPQHSTIKDRTFLALYQAATGCTVRSAGPRVQAPGYGRDNYAYPDVVVTCGDERFDESTQPPTLLNPTLLVEVLSASTGRRDLEEKFEAYFRLGSVREYWIVDPDRVHVRRCTRTEGGVLVQMLQDPADVLASDSLGIEIPLADIYAR